MTSFPTSIHDGPYSTNTLVSRKFLIIYGINIWISFYVIIIEFLFYYNLFKSNIILLFLSFPIQLFIGYFILVFSSLLTAKLLLIFVNLIHKPKEGNFRRVKDNKDYYFWSLRAVIKKWPIWIISLLPSSVLNNLTLTIFGIKTSFTSSINNANMDTEFIELGRNITLGKGSFIKSSMIYGDYLIIKKVIIQDNVIIGPHSYISPGTKIENKTILNTLSLTQFNQILEQNSIYSGYPARKKGTIEDKQTTDNSYIKQKIQENERRFQETSKKTTESYKPAEKFIKKIPTYIAIFLLLYFAAYMPVLIVSYYYFTDIFYPFVLASPSFSDLFITNTSMLILTFTPPFIMVMHLSNIFLTVFITKICYYIICKINKPKEGVFHWKNKSRDYDYYFLRSFLLRYIKWKIQRGPYPWLIKKVFNFIGNCQFGKNSIIEDMYLAKEFLNVGKNVYLGKILLTTQLWDKDLTIKSVSIKDGVVINDGCCIAPGTIIKKNTHIMPFSIVSKNEIIDPNSIYYDAPAKKMKNFKDFKDLFNLDISNFIKIIKR
ncbi:MAG: hypothetical protein EU543_00785 [Promethearchaeota archaeon]|nr:MAG: hypothetical protein EU543_00785 [Candidatus Lokiarchaeota archaeon]